jgi:cytochrome b subunit of formate dehydrogenase
VASSTEQHRALRPTVERNTRRARWLHATVYATVLPLLATGWWLLTGHEGRPSVLARVTGVADVELHTVMGWVFAVVAASGTVIGWRAAVVLMRRSVRFRRSDLRWFARWPVAVATGRFARHEGHFDPGQRVANLVMVTLLGLLIGSGAGLVMVSGGPAYMWLSRVHRWSTYVVTPVILGHVLVGAGVLPGYRGVWRAMHAGGRLRRDDAQRVWPEWLARRDSREPPG